MQVQCKDCPVQFEITDSEVDFYKNKGLALPKRCEPCRKLNRNRHNGNANKPFQGKFNHDRGNREDRPRRTF